MNLNEAYEKLEREVDPPVTRHELLETCRDVEIDCPAGEATNLTDVLETDDTSTYSCLQEIHETVMGNLDESHVGRKYYDDRGPWLGGDQVSF